MSVTEKEKKKDLAWSILVGRYTGYGIVWHSVTFVILFLAVFGVF